MQKYCLFAENHVVEFATQLIILQGTMAVRNVELLDILRRTAVLLNEPWIHGADSS
jgi:hypothetical protein